MSDTSHPAPITYAPDGSPVEAFALLPPGPAVDLLDTVLPPAATVLDLGCGAGRLARALHGRGHRVTGVDQCAAMLAHVPEAIDTHLADIEGVDLGPTFDAVVLSSFLLNTTDPVQREEFLLACTRHVAPGGSVYLNRLDPELIPVAVDAASEEDGIIYAMEGVRHAGPRFEATMRFTINGREYTHQYAGLVLDDDALAKALAPHGLSIFRFLDGQRTWVEVRP